MKIKNLFIAMTGVVLVANVAQSAIFYSEDFDPAPMLYGQQSAGVPGEVVRGDWAHWIAAITDVGGSNSNVLRLSTHSNGATRGAGVALAAAVFTDGIGTYDLQFDLAGISDPVNSYLDVQIWDAAAGTGSYEIDTVVAPGDLLRVLPGTGDAVIPVTNKTAIAATGSYTLTFDYDGSDDVVLLFGIVTSSGTTDTIDIDNVSVATASANLPPEFNTDPFTKSNAVVGIAYTNSILADATDPESDPMTFSLISEASWLNVSNNGTVIGTPGTFDGGTNTFTVQIDATGGTDTATLTIVVDPAAAVGAPPAFNMDTFSALNATLGVAYTNSIGTEAFDPDGDPMTFSKRPGGPVWLDVAPDGTITGIPASEGLNMFSVGVSATGGVDTAILNIIVDPAPVAWNDHNVSVDFSAAEGYVDGDLDTHSNWLAMAENTVSTNADGYNGAKGVVAFDTDSPYRDAVYNSYATMLTPDDSISTVSTFRFDSLGTGSSNTAYILHAHLYCDAWDVGANEIRVMFRRNKNTPDTFDIQTRAWNDANASNYKYSSTVTGTALGLSSGIGPSAWLKLTSTLTKGADAAAWSISVKIENLTAGTTPLDETLGSDVASQTAFYNAGTYYPGLTSGGTDAQCEVAANSRVVDLFESSTTAIELIGEPPVFSSDSLTKPNATEGVDYINSMAGDASDPDGDPMTFSLISSPGWLSVSTNGMVTGTPGASDVGTNNFTVHVSAVGGSDTATLTIAVDPKPVEQTGWREFAESYGLSGSRYEDQDHDEVSDIIEFAYGGNPTNSADTPASPYIEFNGSNSVSFFTLETTHTNSGITYITEWADNLVSGVWNSVWSGTNTVAAAFPDYNFVEYQRDAGSNNSLFFRRRLFRTTQPNILVILCDDLGYADVGFGAALFGEKATSTVSPVTPHIDTLANNGVICSQAYIPHPFCGPSRMGLLAGRYPHHFGGSKNMPYETLNLPQDPDMITIYGYEPANDLGIPTNEVTMAAVLQDAGYRTGAFGKWHCGVAPHAHPNAVGFDYWYGMLGGGHNYYSEGWMSKTNPAVLNDYQMWLTRNGEEVPPPNVPAPGLYITDMLSDDAVDFIQTTPEEQPFFMYLCYNAPHAPLQAKVEDLQTLFGGDGQDENYSKQQRNVAMMYTVDRGVSNLVEALTAKGVLDDTLIIFFSDNGGKEVGDSDPHPENDADNGPFKGGKGDTYEGGVRSPMFIHYPNAIIQGTFYDHPVYPYDLYPTFARLGDASIPVTKVLSGKDIWSEILANQNAHVDDTVFWVRHNAGANNVSMRKGRYKANRLNQGNWKLYDIVSDVSESNDISSGNQAIIDEMLIDGNLWRTEGVDPLWHDTEVGYEKWETNNMPNYVDSFTP